jgi:hypothetical protein
MQENDPTDVKVITDFCRAVDNRFFSNRLNLINSMLEGKSCIETYNLIYPGTYAENFDPIA